MLHTLLTAIAAALPLGLVLGALLGAAALRRRTAPLLSARVEALLPQTQCGECGYAGCRPYAEAVADGAPYNRCAPGGQATVKQLAALLDVGELPLDFEGQRKPRHAVAFIREAECIGCTKCIQACPVDAIVGAARFMHTVIADECTGCDLCVAPCPVDCIDMLALDEAPAAPQPGPVECIRCGLCAEPCPAALQPQQLYWFARAGNRAELAAQRLSDCIECGACDQACPSAIPLVQHFRAAKHALREERAQQRSAGHAARRFEAHQQRSRRDAERKAARLAMRLEQARPKLENPRRKEDKQAEIRAAIARAHAKKAALRGDSGSET